MEEMKTLDKEYYKKELETAIRDLTAARNEIKYLEDEIQELTSENSKMKERLQETISEMNEMKHEDEVIITTKHKICDIEITFK